MGSYQSGFYGVCESDRSCFAALITQSQGFGFPYQLSKSCYLRRICLNFAVKPLVSC
ncbi:hypothetical protein [Mastigocladopsis repens]|uniref:hypothetical protein n=1 Tax=Mastigocladopsis repens TaxID=221287 RepID=UPI00030745A2|nr:hypothetical protein [Mastigocladopsis repens]